MRPCFFLLFFFLQEDQAELLEAAGLDPEALAALPPEMRQEVLEQVRRHSLFFHVLPRQKLHRNKQNVDLAKHSTVMRDVFTGPKKEV